MPKDTQIPQAQKDAGNPRVLSFSWALSGAPFFKRLQQTARLMIGLPDYDTYVAFLKKRSPWHPIPSREQFFKDCVDTRYRPGMGKGCG